MKKRKLYHEMEPFLLQVIVMDIDLDLPVEEFFIVQEPMALFPLEEEVLEVKLHFVFLIEEE